MKWFKTCFKQELKTEWTKTLLPQIQVENTVTQVTSSNPAWDCYSENKKE